MLAEQRRTIGALMSPDTSKEAELNAELRTVSRELESWKLRASKLTDAAAAQLSRSAGSLAAAATPALGGLATKETAEMVVRLQRLEQENAKLQGAWG